jgi:hypothetical protein
MVGLLGFVNGLQKQIIINENAAVIYSAYVPIQLFNLHLPQDASSLGDEFFHDGVFQRWTMSEIHACPATARIAVDQKSNDGPGVLVCAADSVSGGGRKYGTNFTPRCLTCPRVTCHVCNGRVAVYLEKIRGALWPPGLQAVDRLKPATKQHV